MKRALVLNAGLAWGAYQIGALRHLIRDRQLHFDLCAGSGIGAMNAALVACGRFEALEAFWNRIGLRRLLRPNLRSLWLGPATGAPQRAFIEEHVSEKALEERGSRLCVNVFNLQTGAEELYEYPGSSLPILDAIMAAVATPGLCPPVLHQGQQLAEGTFIHGFLLESVAEREIEEIYAVAASLPDEPLQLRRYAHFREVLRRSVEMNQTHDVRDGRKAAGDIARAAEAFRRVRALPERLAALIDDAELRERVQSATANVYARSRFSLKRQRGPHLHVIVPSRELVFAPWSFRRHHLADARALGYDDAVRSLQAGAA